MIRNLLIIFCFYGGLNAASINNASYGIFYGGDTGLGIEGSVIIGPGLKRDKEITNHGLYASVALAEAAGWMDAGYGIRSKMFSATTYSLQSGLSYYSQWDTYGDIYKDNDFYGVFISGSYTRIHTKIAYYQNTQSHRFNDDFIFVSIGVGF
ncbi:MAG: hypothetical protein HRU15_03320 [Planctomycetes bacterium]|nr:hypothetical protein [Planctomycetota bacterium]